MPFDKVDYDNINPWEFLDNLAVNAIILKASYCAVSKMEMANKCDAIVTHALELKTLINESNM